MLKQIITVVVATWTVVILTLSAAGAAPAEKTFRWKLKPGENLKYRMLQDVAQNVAQGEGKPALALNTTMTMDITWKVDAVDGQGTITMDQVIDKIQIKVQSAQGVILEYDSGTGREPEGLAKMLAPMFDSMLKKPFRITFTSRGETKGVKLPQGMVENLNKVSGLQMGNFLSEDSLKQFRMMSVFPEGPIAPGQSWSHESTAKFPFLGAGVTKTTFRYEGTETRDGKTLDKIALTMSVKPEEKKPDAKAEQPERKPEPFGLTMSDSKGAILFDNEAGRIVESTMEMKMKIEMTVMGQKISQDLDMKMRMAPAPAEPASAPPASAK